MDQFRKEIKVVKRKPPHIINSAGKLRTKADLFLNGCQLELVGIFSCALGNVHGHCIRGAVFRRPRAA
jgi:hypothetical protein